MKTIADIKDDNGKILFGDLTGQVYKSGINVRREELESLKGSPKEVKQGFNVSKNNITSLEYGPEIVNGDYDISNNPITSLDYAPTLITGTFYCDATKIPKNTFKEDIIKHRIKATYYNYDNIGFFFSEIKKEFESFVEVNKRVTRKSMRTLLGLDK